MRIMKKFAIICTAMFIFCCIHPLQAHAGIINTVNAAVENTGVKVTGTTGTDVLAVVVQVRDASNDILTMETFSVKKGGAFEAPITLNLAAGSYKVYVADFDGGAWSTADFTVAASGGGTAGGGSGTGSGSNQSNTNTGSTGGSSSSGSSSGSTSSSTTNTNTPVLVETVTATETKTTNKTTQPTKVVTIPKTPSKTEEKVDEKLVLPYQQAKEKPVSDILQVSFGEGIIKVSVESQDEKGNTKGEGTIGVALRSFDNVLNAVLTEEEQREVKAGNTVEVRLSMKKLTQEIPPAEKTAMEELVAQKSTQISGLTIGTYMDISMEKKLGNKDWKKLTNLNEEVEITIDVPEDLQMAGAQYWVVKNHNGEVSLLEDLDNKEDTVTIKSGEFSTYAIAYAVSNVEDVDADGVESVEDVPVEEVQTQETGLAWYWWLLPVAVLVIAIVGYTVYKKNSSDEE